jgi:UDP-N-acetylglucosamine--N-acetylmuramyl-(pentapeptide) pyrophosphoryl-undecaprenol N-acetylglucosamine transferase
MPFPLRGAEQRLNAEPIVVAGGGLLVADADCTPSWVIANVVPVLTDPDRLAAMGRAAHSAGARDAAETMARAVLEVASVRRP